MDTDVLVIGAGPVGLTLAHELHRRGVACRLVDRAAGPAEHSRALVLHCRTLEHLEKAGLRERLAAEAIPVRGVRFRRGSRTLGGIPFDLGPYPALSLPQTRTEAGLTSALAERGGSVTWGAGLTALHASEDSVVATVGDREVSARYVVGCDGGRSTVRELAGIAFEGEDLPETIWMADAMVDWDVEPDRVWQFIGQGPPLSAIPMPGGEWRLATKPGAGAEPGAEFFADAVARRLGRERATLVTSWISQFRVQCRLAGAYGQGRVLLAGDAAHVHSPMGGQGMNVGMQDSFDLAARLASELLSRPAELLSSYEAARRPVARSVIDSNARLAKLAASNRPVPRFVRDHVLPNVLRLPAPARRAGRQASGLGTPSP